jgi:hypothetical protein
VNDAFISYSRQDEGWAKKLDADLRALGCQVFLDTRRLTAGDDWDTQLQSAIRDSRHLIVMWSDNADRSEWVKMEMAYFERERETDPGRRLHIHINLQGRSKVFSKRETIDEIEKAGAFGSGIGSIDARLWRQVIDKIDEAIRQGGAIPVYKVILASTLGVLTEIPLNKSILGGPTYGETLEAIGIKRQGASPGDWKDELKSYYGGTRSDWKPFQLSRSWLICKPLSLQTRTFLASDGDPSPMTSGHPTPLWLEPRPTGLLWSGSAA